MYYSYTPAKCKQTRICQVCGKSFPSPPKARTFCSPDCLPARAPVVYRFVCPDGRSYVGSVSDSRNRFNNGIARSNSRLIAAFAKYPPETWTYEILEELRPGCSVRELREAEQRYMELFASLVPEGGFNIHAALINAHGRLPSHVRRLFDEASSYMKKNKQTAGLSRPPCLFRPRLPWKDRR
jgi:hypothetical protein